MEDVPYSNMTWYAFILCNNKVFLNLLHGKKKRTLRAQKWAMLKNLPKRQRLRRRAKECPLMSSERPSCTNKRTALAQSEEQVPPQLPAKITHASRKVGLPKSPLARVIHAAKKKDLGSPRRCGDRIPQGCIDKEGKWNHQGCF